MSHGSTKAIPIDTDSTLAANRDDLVPSQKAVKTKLTTIIESNTHAATSKTTPVDADEIPLIDSAASFSLKNLTWANLKATLKTYFDTQYWNGNSGAWITWTPTLTNLTIGNGTIVARYKLIDTKTAVFEITVTLAANSSVGISPTFTLPFTLANSSLNSFGDGSIYDLSATTRYNGCCVFSNTTTLYFGLWQVSSTNITSRGITATIPFTFATGDIIHCSATVEIA